MVDMNGFDANEVDPAEVFNPIPTGEYPAAIVESEMKPVKSGNGNYMKLTFQIIEGEFKGRKLWDQLCLQHTNAVTVEIAQRKLSAICHAVGVMKPRDSVELHNLPLMVKVACKKREDTGEIGNEIKGYKRKEATAAAEAAPQASESTPPWQRS